MKNIEISFIIPCYISDQTIKYCLDSLYNQKGQFKKEIIIVDSSPNDSLKYLIDSYKNIIYIHHNQRLNPGQSRNIGIKYAKGDFIAFIDSDTVLNKFWLINSYAKYIELSKIHDFILLSGSIKNSSITSNYINNALFLILFYEFLESKISGFRKKLFSANLFISRENVLKYNFFFPDFRISEDTVLSRLILSKKGKLYFLGTNSVSHIKNMAFLKSMFLHGKGSAIYRLNSRKWYKKFSYLALLPVGWIYKLGGMFRGLLKYNIQKISLLIFYLPIIIPALIVLNLGMFYQSFFMVKYISNKIKAQP